jgi:hypothetical protein
MSKYIGNAAKHLASSHTPAHSSECQPNRVWEGKFSLSCCLNSYQYTPFSFSQTLLEGVVTREAKCPVFTKAGLMDYIIELIICEDKVSKTHILVMLH